MRIKPLRPSYRRDLIDHHDIIVLSLGLGAGCSLFVNVYSDSNHTAITTLHEGVWTWPNLMVMGGDFNVRHKNWDLNYLPESNIHAERLVAAADRLGLSRCLPVVPGPTHFPFNQFLSPMVIDLLFIRDELSIRISHHILPDARVPSDHAPLVITVPGPDSLVPVTWWSIKPESVLRQKDDQTGD
jgi:Endonuclease-reverse transcriptase